MRCTMCGHDSPTGSLFCLNCGSQLAAGYAAQTPGAAPGLPAAGRCPTCGTDNPGNMKFCRNCGTVLATTPVPPAPGAGPSPFAGPPGYGASPSPFAPPGPPGPPPGPPAPSYPGAAPTTGSGMVVCPRCGSQTPSGFAFCQQCGVQLPNVDPQGPTMAGSGDAALRAGSIGRAQPVGGGGAMPLPSSAPPGPAAMPAPAPSPSPSMSGRPGPTSSPGRASPSAAPATVSAAAWGTAVSVNRDGTDGERFSLAAEYVTIGRGGADVAFDQDRFLARSHARLEKSGDTVRVVPLDTLNGVFRKLDSPLELVDSAIVLVGREVLRFELLDADERAAEPLVRHGVALFGSPPREPWGRFVQMLPSGGVRDIRHLWGDEVVLGREEGDIIFRDDAFMSRRHAAVTWDGRRATLTDLGSSNGTFVRLTGPTAVRNNDQLRMGDQLFRFELRR